MSGEGHIADMIARMKNNKALRNEHKERQKKLNDVYRKSSGTHENIQMKGSEISPERLENLKESIHVKAIREQKSGLIETSILTAIILLALVLIIFWIF